MAWFKVDDGFYHSRKVMAIPRRQRAAALGLWILAGTWCADEENDGRVPAESLDDLCGTTDVASVLVAAGLWEVDGDGYLFHDWPDYQPTRAQNDAKRAEARDRMATARAAKKPAGSPNVRANNGRTRTNEREHV